MSFSCHCHFVAVNNTNPLHDPNAFEEREREKMSGKHFPAKKKTNTINWMKMVVPSSALMVAAPKIDYW